MKKIIKQGIKPGEITCPHCGTLYSYEDEDILYGAITRNGDVDLPCLTCPLCENLHFTEKSSEEHSEWITLHKFNTQSVKNRLSLQIGSEDTWGNEIVDHPLGTYFLDGDCVCMYSKDPEQKRMFLRLIDAIEKGKPKRWRFSWKS